MPYLRKTADGKHRWFSREPGFAPDRWSLDIALATEVSDDYVRALRDFGTLSGIEEVDDARFFAMLTNALQEQKHYVDALEEKHADMAQRHGFSG